MKNMRAQARMFLPAIKRFSASAIESGSEAGEADGVASEIVEPFRHRDDNESKWRGRLKLGVPLRWFEAIRSNGKRSEYRACSQANRDRIIIARPGFVEFYVARQSDPPRLVFAISKIEEISVADVPAGADTESAS